MMRNAVLAVCAMRLVAAAPAAATASGSVQDPLAAYAAIATQIQPAVSVPTGAVDQTVSYNPTPAESSAAATATAGALQKRQDACQPYPPGGGPAVHNPDTPEAFEAYPPFQRAAYQAPVPFGYYPVANFRDLNASASTVSYMGVNSSFTSYDVNACASQCNAITGCNSFNMFFERDPTVNANDQGCPNPPSLTRIKCSFWGVPLSASTATNFGQYQSDFHVVIAGSDAYNAYPTGPSGSSNAQQLDGAFPYTQAAFMGAIPFPNQPYEPQFCYDACYAKNSVVGGRQCKMFNTYMLTRNGDNPTFMCAFFDQVMRGNQATFTGSQDAFGNSYSVSYSYEFVMN